MAWILLRVAGLLEVGWAIGLKYTDGFTKLWASIFTGRPQIGKLGLVCLAASASFRVQRVACLHPQRRATQARW